MAEKLGTVGHLTALKRIAVGGLMLKDCVGFSEIEEKWMSTVV
jgi:tRNA U55 pseudouridine synthase TruB